VLAKLSVALGRLRFTQSRLVSPACRFACSLATWIPLRVLDVGSTRLSGSPGTHRTTRENWKEGNARSTKRSIVRKCDRDEGMRNDARARTKYTAKRDDERDATTRQQAGSEPVAAVAAVNRTGALNPRRPRSVTRLLRRLPLYPSKRLDRFAKLHSRDSSRRFTCMRMR